MKKKKILGIIIVMLFFGDIIITNAVSYFERKHFFESKLNTVVTRIKNNLTFGRSYDYLTKAGVVITLMNGDSYKLQVTDSIVKDANSWKYNVFRIEEFGPKYTFYKSFDLEKSNQ